MPKCFSAWNAVLNKSVTMHFRHEKQMKHNGTRLMNILIFYSLIMSFSRATCMSTLGFCIIIFLFSESLPSTTLYYKACTKHFPILLCTAKLAQVTSQYYFVLQSLHKALPSTTLYYKACTKHFPVLLCTTKLAKNYFPKLLAKNDLPLCGAQQRLQDLQGSNMGVKVSKLEVAPDDAKTMPRRCLDDARIWARTGFPFRTLKIYTGKRPQTVWAVGSQCKQQELWNGKY